MSLTPYMGLNLPSPQVTPGPAYASLLTASMTGALYTVDKHRHTGAANNDGQQLGVESLLIDGNLNMQGYVPFNALAWQMAAASSTLTGATYAGSVFMYNNNLYFCNGTGAAVQITNGSAVAGSTGTITGLPSGTAGAAYNSISGNFVFTSATSTSAGVDCGPLLVRASGASAPAATVQFSGSSGVTVNLPQVNMTLPTALPGSTMPLQMTASGVVSAAQLVTGQLPVYTSGGGSGAFGYAQSSGALFVFSNTSGWGSAIETVTLTVSGTRPVVVMLVPDGTTTSSGLNVGCNGTPSGSQLSPAIYSAGFAIFAGSATNPSGTPLAATNVRYTNLASFSSNFTGLWVESPASLVYFDPAPSAGSLTFSLYGQVAQGTNGTGAVRNVALLAFEV